MPVLIIQSGSIIGPFKTVEVLSDRLRCDGAEYPLNVIGKYQISEDDSLAPVPIPDPAEVSRQADIAITAMLDREAQSLRWIDMRSARAAAGVPLSGDESIHETEIHNQAVALAQWDRKCWAKSLEIEAEVIAGTRTLPTAAEIIAEMPAME